MIGKKPRRLSLIIATAAIMGLMAAACSASADEASARSAVEDLRGGEFMRSGSVGRFGIDVITVEGECAVARIIELPDLYKMSIFLRWDGGRWLGTDIVTGHSAPIDITASDCWRD